MRGKKAIIQKLNLAKVELEKKKVETLTYTHLQWIMRKEDVGKKISALKAEINILKWVLNLQE